MPGGGNYQHYVVTDHDRRAARIIAQIPPTAKVSAQDKLDPHVAGRESIYIFPRIDDADTIFVDVTGPAWPQHPSDLYREIQQLLAGDFGVAAAEDGYLLLRKDAPSATIPEAFYSAFRRPLPAVRPVTQNVSVFGEQLVLWDHQVKVDEHGETVIQLFWERLSNRPVTKDYQIYVAFADRAGNLLHENLFYPPVATLWYPTSLWQSDEMVLVQTLPWPVEVDQFTLLVGVYEGEEGWQSGGRLPLSTGSTPDRIHVEENTLARLAAYQRQGKVWKPVALPTSLETGTVIDAEFGSAPILLSLPRVQITTVPQKGGEPLQFALELWAHRALVQAHFDYSLFAHVVNEQGEKVAQLDWQPHDDWGPRPMTTWFEGTSIVDKETIVLPAALPPGNYRLLLGVYNWQTGERLVAHGNAAAPDNVVTIARFSIQ
ncbi:MAG: DUF2079 domain-containing protein [Caldilineaceae bacterium]